MSLTLILRALNDEVYSLRKAEGDTPRTIRLAHIAVALADYIRDHQPTEPGTASPINGD